jgi:hypothetical protein
MNLAMFSAVFCCFVIKGLIASVLSVKPVSFPLPRSLSRYAPAVRLRRADGAHRQKSHRHHPEKEKNRREKATALPFFHRLRPLTSITKSDAQISGGETRQDYKDTRRFPWWLPRALSCSCLSVYRCHSAVMAAFISFHA